MSDSRLVSRSETNGRRRSRTSVFQFAKIKINLFGLIFFMLFKRKSKPTLQYIALVSRLKISEDVNQSDGKSDSFATDTAVCWLLFSTLKYLAPSGWLLLGASLFLIACDLKKKVIDITPTTAATVDATTYCSVILAFNEIAE